MRPLDYAMEACDMMMEKYRPEELPPRGHFHYHQGVFLSGMQKTWRLCKKEAYMNYIRDWVDSCLLPDGHPRDYDPKQLDDLQPGILLYPLLDWTGEERYKTTLDILTQHLLEIPRTPSGGIWHKGDSTPDQMWLDGLYMGGPLAAEYGKRFDRPEFISLVVQQALLMQEKTRDPKTGLLYHAYDESKQAEWADPVTGLSPEFWGRSIGWVPVAVLDDLDFMVPYVAGGEELKKLVQDLMEAVVRYQTESGMWYQVVNKPEQEGNWPEVSCTCLFTAALCKGVRTGVLKPEYLENARRGYEAVIKTLKHDENGKLVIGGVCIGTGVGDYEHYIKRPVSENDLHGVGAFLLMCQEAEQVL